MFDEEDRKRRNVEFKEKSEDIVGKKEGINISRKKGRRR